MAVSLNSLLPFNSTLQSYKHVSISSRSISTTTIHSKQRRRRRVVCVSVSDSDKGTTEAAESKVSDSGDDPGALNGSVEAKQSTRKRSKARERLKAARVLSRYNSESKAAAEKPAEMGSNVLDAMRQSDGGKRRSGLPEAPTNLFDDSKRGLPKPGWTFQFPGGSDLFLIVVSFVLISSIMFTTTYIVWKVGAIHFNEY